MVDMLDLANVPLHASERTALTPLVVAGGTAMYNCEPIADFIDLALIGEGEEMDVELIELHRQARREGWSKHEFLVCAAQIPGVYVPSLYDVAYNDDGTVKSITANEGAPKVVLKRIMRDMDKAYYPTKTHRSLDRDRAGPCVARTVSRLHPRLPLLSGGVCLPSRAQPLGGAAARLRR